MQLTDVLAEVPAGLYVLTASGELGAYDAQCQLHIDEPLSRAFAEHSRDFLRAHLQDPLADDRPVAILFASLEPNAWGRSEEHTSELQSHLNLVCRLLLEKKK